MELKLRHLCFVMTRGCDFMMLSLDQYIAKTEFANQNGNLSLGYHVCQVLERLSEIYNQRSSQDSSLFKAVAKAVIFHDLGKISVDFQSEILKKFSRNEKTKRYNDAIAQSVYESIRGHNPTKIKRHEVLSVIWTLLIDDSSEEIKKIRTAILYHHYNQFYAGEDGLLKILALNADSVNIYLKFMKDHLAEFPKFLEYLNSSSKWPEPIAQAIEELINCCTLNLIKENYDKMVEAFENRENLSDILTMFHPGHKSESDLTEEDYEFFVLLGSLRRSDHAGSAGVPMTAPSSKKVLTCIKDKFNEIHSNNWQSEVLNKIEQKKSLVLVAPTGSGKTEFALLWTELTGKRLIYTLPLRVALDDIYENRMKELLGPSTFTESFEDCVSLLHSTSHLSHLNQNPNQDIGKQLSECKLFKAPLMFTTADQIMLSSLYYYGFDMLFSLYPESVVVIDEIQAYTPDMVAIIINTIEHIHKLKSQVLIVTATFPPYLKKLLEDDNQINIFELSKSKFKDRVKNYETKRHKIQINEEYLIKKNENKSYSISSKLESDITKIIANEQKVLIIANTVVRAIEIFKYLNDKKLPCNNLFLLHSRLPIGARIKKIKELSLLLKRNKDASQKDGPVILVATQIVEASVNFDFDVLYTELSPIDSQIQRWGRVYRNRNDKNYESNEANIIIFTKQDSEVNKIYDKVVLDATEKFFIDDKNKKVFENSTNFESEINFIEKIFDTETCSNNGSTQSLCDNYLERINEYRNYFKVFSAIKRSEAQRLFRSFSTKSIVIPELIENEELRKMVLDPESTDLTWKEIITRLEREEKNGKFKILKELTEASVSIPQGVDLYTRDFKGFDIRFGTKLTQKKIDDLILFGADAVLDELRRNDSILD